MYQTLKKERALLVVVKTYDETWSRAALSGEFRNLALSTGIAVEGLVSLNLSQPNPAFYIGKGKVAEIAAQVKDEGANVVIFDNNLNFTQQRNLEQALGVKTIDRTQLILDVFAKHAQTQEGILQVELAQSEYLLPRLRGKGIALSRLGGGIGTRGPGEKKLEVDRRRISDRIAHLKKDLKLVKQHRSVMRKKREKAGLITCSLVGYTNAGKTTLFNALTDSRQVTSSDLFTTLDTTTRTLDLGNHSKAVLSDTVGFIYRLPPNLIEAFKATLEELNYADILLHVIDAANRDLVKLKQSVDSTLENLGLDKKPAINVFNKTDCLAHYELDYLMEQYPRGIFVSAKTGVNLDKLKETIYSQLFKDMVKIMVKVPFNRMDVVNHLHDNFQILKTEYRDKEAVFWIMTKKSKLAYIEKQGLEVEEI